MYDLIYSFKDYQKESEEIAQLIHSKKPEAQKILDVGCGTAEHHKYLRNQFSITGLDINPGFIKIAKRKIPFGEYYIGDMREFELDQTFDVILCMFSSIGYVKDFEEMVSTLKSFRSHLSEEGLLIVEPWITPENWYEGKVHMLTYENEGVKICRMNKSETEGKHSVINFHYLIGTAKEGVRHFEERHELILLSVEKMKEAFALAGLSVEHDPEGLIGRGMYYAKAT
ncbi:MAG: class I SAM-dependent methyltransferase [Bacteroidota bacterium]